MLKQYLKVDHSPKMQVLLIKIAKLNKEKGKDAEKNYMDKLSKKEIDLLSRYDIKLKEQLISNLHFIMAIFFYPLYTGLDYEAVKVNEFAEELKQEKAYQFLPIGFFLNLNWSMSKDWSSESYQAATIRNGKQRAEKN